MRLQWDLPAAGERCDPLCLKLEGWVALGPGEEVAAVEFLVDGVLRGQTACLAPRPDVAAALQLPLERCLGFLHFGHFPPERWGAPARLEVRVRGRDGGSPPAAQAGRELSWIERDYRGNHYGVLLDAATTRVFHRENIYGSGPSQPGGSEELLGLVRGHAGAPPRRIIDVGCGLGWYGRHLRQDGHDWTGAEMKPADCAELARLGLPHRQVDGRSLPFPDASFDAAMAIEVLEHTEDPRAFLAEIRRVAPGRLLISVPNAELIPYLQHYQAAPWHLLEGDHKNFFTRWSLGAQLREFYPRVEVMCHRQYPLATPEGTPVYYQLFAVAWDPARA
ncbi:MAG TPA: class I SAM-dependent methyltransferase [Opitutaceae bacterium]|nr:class I SAM-dependent methyltransferase [Opitutaceae bacterium]